MSALHIYGVVRPDRSPKLSVEGVAGAVRIVAEGRAAAIVGAPPPRALWKAPQEHVLFCLLKHQQTLEAAMGEASVLPVRFGSVAPDEAALRSALNRGGALLRTKLDEFFERQQMHVEVSWDLEVVFADIARELHVFQALQAMDESPGELTRVEAGRLVKESLDRRRRSLSRSVFEELTTVAADIIETSPEDDDVVADFALLLDKADQLSLEGVLNRLDADFGGSLNFRCVGPLPPSCFALVEFDFAARDPVGIIAARRSGADEGASRFTSARRAWI
jgi:hypothetical protein